MDSQDIDRIIETANHNIANGVIQEPRVFFDEIEISADGLVSFGSPDAFRNGEEYPIRIRWMTAGLRWLAIDGSTVTADERLIQRVSARFTYHGHDYMRREFVPLPLWHDVPVAAGVSLERGHSAWRFDRPFILSARDSMLIRVKLDASPTASNNRPITVGLTGFGLDSRQPYFRSATVNAEDDSTLTLNTDLFRNDGEEPIVMTDMTLHTGAESQAQNPQGDIRISRLSIQQLGNGTNANWIQGPNEAANGTSPGPDLVPSQLLGCRSGRVIVHDWPPTPDKPDGGLYWEPGEGLQVEVQAPEDLAGQGVSAPVLVLALIGTIIVT